MKQFPDKLHLIDAGISNNTRIFELEMPFIFNSSKGTITVPAGFRTDGYSIPKALHSLANPFCQGMESSVVHDFLYNTISGKKFNRQESDEIFLEGMKVCGVNYLKRHLIFLAVRMFGWQFFKKK